jgi:hypothetical protein
MSNTLNIIVAGINPLAQDAYSSRLLKWVNFGDDWLSETTDGKFVEYGYLQMQDGSGDVARARLVGPYGIEKIAYIKGVHSEDVGLGAKLCDMLGVETRWKKSTE